MATRAEVVAQIEQRLARAGVRQAASQCVQIALAASTRDPKELLEYMCSEKMLLRTGLDVKKCAITTNEFGVLFGPDTKIMRDANLEKLIKLPEFLSGQHRLEKALRCTIFEQSGETAWKQSSGRASAYVAMHIVDCESAISAVLGGFVHADSRRLGELVEQMEDDETVDVMVLGRVIVSLSDAMCAKVNC